MKIIKTFFLLCAVPAMLMGALLYDVPVELQQPDGTTLHCFASGDEYYSRLHDGDGYTITQSNEDGFYYYALLKGGDIRPSTLRADQTQDLTRAGISPRIMIHKEEYLAIRDR